MPAIPANVRFRNEHLWVAPPHESLLQTGVTNYAQQNLGDTIDVRAPGGAATTTAGKPCGEFESTKSVSDLISPLTGAVERRNDERLEAPDLINSDLYGEGWIFEPRVDAAMLAKQLSQVMDADAYRSRTGG
jgi:glycine cleavage system H protein